MSSAPSDILGDAKVAVKKDGSGVFLNWRAITGIVIVVGLIVKLYAGITGTLDAHSVQLAAQQLNIYHVNLKVDALLIKQGLDPAKIVKERDGEDSNAR